MGLHDWYRSSALVMNKHEAKRARRREKRRLEMERLGLTVDEFKNTRLHIRKELVREGTKN